MQSYLQPLRLMIFVDFWNYTLNMRELYPTFQTNWFNFPLVLAKEAELVTIPLSGSYLQYHGIFIAGSYDQLTQVSLNNWAQNTLTKVSGANVDFKPRKKMITGPCCTGPMHHEIDVCPQCGASMKGTKEKGVDSQIITEMLRRAWEKTYDVGMIVSEDGDFVPAIQYLSGKGFRFLHARFPGVSHELRKHCWGEIDIPNVCSNFKR